jgi:hypothetical protein
MNWALAISRNRTALLAVVAAIVALVGRADTGGMLARGLRNAALALLRPAEAAARRLIVIAARGLALPAVQRQPFTPIAARADGSAPAGTTPRRPPAFRLTDPAKRYFFTPPRRKARFAPRIRIFWGPGAYVPPEPALTTPATAAPQGPDAPVPAGRLHLRIAALERALADLPGQARRLVRWRARVPVLWRDSPLRLGYPPGWRQRPTREVDLVLRECRLLAADVLKADTS